ncbi:MAG: hypothetical protein V3V16_04860 [Melioribacteraceae bacterium]
MKTPVVRKKNSFEFAFILAVILAVILYLLLYVLGREIYLNYELNSSEQYVSLDYNTFEKLKPKKVSHPRKEVQTKKNNQKEVLSKKKKLFKEPYFETNINTIEKIDSSIHPTNQFDSSKTFDSFIANNPNLIALKIALKRNIDNGVITKTEAEITEGRIKKAMFDYYKAKYPTPPYKFGELGTGNLINIPIDDVIELFK